MKNITIKFAIKRYYYEVAISILIASQEKITKKRIENELRCLLKANGTCADGHELIAPFEDVLPIAKKFYPELY